MNYLKFDSKIGFQLPLLLLNQEFAERPTNIRGLGTSIQGLENYPLHLYKLNQNIMSNVTNQQATLLKRKLMINLCRYCMQCNALFNSLEHGSHVQDSTREIYELEQQNQRFHNSNGLVVWQS